MDFDETLEESRALVGPLGAAVFVVLRMMEKTGPTGEALEALKAQLLTSEKALDEENRAVLTYVLDQRLAESHGRGAYSGLVSLARRLTIIEAHILQDALVQSGVETRIRREHGSVADVLHPEAGVELWVRPYALAEARRIVDGLRTTADGVRACSSCKEESPAHFGRCWNCGHALDEQEPNADVAEAEASKTDASPADIQ